MISRYCRYAYSGVAFSSAKDGMDLEWCKNPDRGLPEPDLVCFLDVSPEEARKRGGFGQERYEKEAFQVKVRRRYEQLMEQDGGSWRVLQTDGRSLDEVYAELLAVVQGRIQDSQVSESEKKLLWVQNGASDKSDSN